MGLPKGSAKLNLNGDCNFTELVNGHDRRRAPAGCNGLPWKTRKACKARTPFCFTKEGHTPAGVPDVAWRLKCLHDFSLHHCRAPARGHQPAH